MYQKSILFEYGTGCSFTMHMNFLTSVQLGQKWDSELLTNLVECCGQAFL